MLLVLFLLLGTVIVLLNTYPVQNYVAKQAAQFLSKRLNTKVEVKYVHVRLLDELALGGLYIEDQQRDTLLYAGELQLRIGTWWQIPERITIKHIGLSDALARLNRTSKSNVWNYDFIAEAFSGGPKTAPKKANNDISIDLKAIALNNVRLHMDDAWAGEDIDLDIGTVSLTTKKINVKQHIVEASALVIAQSSVHVREYKGGKPPRQKPDSIGYDSTPFNPDGWKVQMATLTLSECAFSFHANRKQPTKGVFDENHLVIKKIGIEAKDLRIDGDTLRANVNQLTAHERCGIEVKQMRTRLSISPVASICENLYIQTNNSRLGDYFALRYKHFPSFLSYIDSVRMIARLRNSSVDTRDIAFFAPEMRAIPAVVSVAGEADGTVANFKTKRLLISDGQSVLKGNIAMAGLPDIYKTKIQYDNGELFTNGAGLSRYFTALRSSEYVDAQRLTHAYFKGTFDGYIENFTVNGAFSTNLGSLEAKVTLNMPKFEAHTASYEGTVKMNDMMLGAFFRQPLLGGITAQGDISGLSFDPDDAQLKMNGFIDKLSFNDYEYKQLSTTGTLSKQHFNGSLLVDDPNLALNFVGNLYYNQRDNLKLNATGQLLYANLQKMNLTKDSVTASADFEFDFTGSNIDDFLGYARTYNVNVHRNNHRVAVDSVHITSTKVNEGKRLDVSSNLLSGYVSGAYQLSQLHTSIQYYLSKYIPNYIKEPLTYPADQNFAFYVTTHGMDSLWAVTVPFIKGFDRSTISGALNTKLRSLELHANLPFGTVAGVHFSGTAIHANGNFDNLGMNTSIDQVYFFDSSLNSSLSFTATLGADSLNFIVATTSPDSGTSFTLNGNVVAQHDTLSLSVLPSQFYVNRVRWDISGNNKVVYTDRYLDVQKIVLTSGLQKIFVGSQLNGTDNKLVVNTENLDLGQLNNYEKFASYQLEGRLNGTVSVERIFDDLNIAANLRALNVRLGVDTVGEVKVSGYYNKQRKTLFLDPITGVYRASASLTAAGTVVFDTLVEKQIDGRIRFQNAHLSWVNPFVTGIFSELAGNVNGTIKCSGTSSAPVIRGELGVADASFKLDYMGCNYRIPTATIRIDNKFIGWSPTSILDRFGNTALLSGHFSHSLFGKIRANVSLTSSKFEMLRLSSTDNNLFYGNVIGSVDSFIIRGPLDDITLHAYNVSAAENSQTYLPVTTGGDLNTYSYVTFKTYGKKIATPKQSNFKLNLLIDANLNELATLTIILDPATGDAITTTGEGRIQLALPPSYDMSINGSYVINKGSYDFTFKELLHRRFQLNSGSTIRFLGPFERTEMDISAMYSQKARLYDLLNEGEIRVLDQAELADAKAQQIVNIIMNMRGKLNSPQLSFNLDLPEKRSIGTYAFTKLNRINQDERQKFDQVGSILLVNSFIASDGLGGGTAASNSLVTSVGQVFTRGASAAVTTALNKIIGDNKLNVDVNFNKYNLNDQIGNSTYNRNQVKIGVSHPFLDDKLIVQVGSTSDWGRPVSANSSATNFNITGDFRIQYLLRQPNGLRLNAFRTSDYDAALDKAITRSGVGLSWRKSFDNFQEFFQSTTKYREHERIARLPKTADTGSK